MYLWKQIILNFIFEVLQFSNKTNKKLMENTNEIYICIQDHVPQGMFVETEHGACSKNMALNIMNILKMK